MSDSAGPSFTAEQVATAANALRRAAGFDPEEFPQAQVVGMLSDEIRQLRDRGVRDDEIARIIAAVGVPIDASVIESSYVDTSEMPRER